MENKTIRVWDKMVDSCGSCIYKTINSGHGYSITACNLLSKWEVNQNIIDPDCPFSKPLSKEQIESCGFILKQHRKFDHLFTFKKNCSNKFYRSIYTLYIQFMEIEDGLIRDKHHIHITWKSDMFGDVIEGCKFSGSINNLPEFKLILKMLNIE